MKKILFTLITIMFAGSLCFAAEPSVKSDEVKTLTGNVESVIKTFPKPPYVRFAIVSVIADSGEKTSIDVVRETIVRDVSGKDMNEGGKKQGAWHLKKGQSVEVKYTTAKNGHNQAISIHCLD